MPLIIINPYMFTAHFWATLKDRDKEYDIVIIKNFFYKLIHFSELPPSINGKYNVKTNCNNINVLKLLKDKFVGSKNDLL